MQHTNADSGTYGTSNDNYWETFYAFATVAGNTTAPYIRHADMSQTLVNGGTATNVRRSIGRWMRWKYVVVDGSGNAAYTGKLRIAWNNAVTE